MTKPSRTFALWYVIDRATDRVLACLGQDPNGDFQGPFVLSNHDTPDLEGLKLGHRAVIACHARGTPMRHLHVFERVTREGEPVTTDPDDPLHAFVLSDRQIPLGSRLAFFDDLPPHRSQARRGGARRPNGSKRQGP